MRAASLLFLILVAAATAESNFQVSGSSSVYAQFSDRESGWSEVPGEFWRWRLNPVFSIYGIPVVASVYTSSEQSAQRQNLNRIYISSSPSASSRERPVLSFISRIGIGAFNPYFSNLTLNAANINGANIALSPGNFYIAAAGGRNERAVNPSNDDPGTYERNIYAVQTGIGSPFGSHAHLCVLHGKDSEGSIIEDSTFRVTPSENWVVSLDCAAMAFDGRLKLEGEVAGSVFTRDTRSPEIDTDQVPQWLIDFSGINVSSGYGWALDVSSSARFSDNMLSLAFRRVEPGFQSMGSPYLRSDLMTIQAGADRYFLGRKITAGLWYRWEQDNLLDSKDYTCTGNTFGCRVGFAFEDLPRVHVSYSPSMVDLGDSSGTEIETSMISVSASYRRDIFDLDVNSSVSLSIHDNSFGSGSGDYSSLSGVIRETVSLHFPVVLTGCFSARRVRNDESEEWSYTGDLRGTWYPSEEFSLTLGGYHSRGDDDRKTGALVSGGFPVLPWLNANLYGEYASLASVSESDCTVMTGGAGLTVVW